MPAGGHLPGGRTPVSKGRTPPGLRPTSIRQSASLSVTKSGVVKGTVSGKRGMQSAPASGVKRLWTPSSRAVSLPASANASPAAVKPRAARQIFSQFPPPLPEPKAPRPTTPGPPPAPAASYPTSWTARGVGQPPVGEGWTYPPIPSPATAHWYAASPQLPDPSPSPGGLAGMMAGSSDGHVGLHGEYKDSFAAADWDVPSMASVYQDPVAVRVKRHVVGRSR